MAQCLFAGVRRSVSTVSKRTNGSPSLKDDSPSRISALPLPLRDDEVSQRHKALPVAVQLARNDVSDMPTTLSASDEELEGLTKDILTIEGHGFIAHKTRNLNVWYVHKIAEASNKANNATSACGLCGTNKKDYLQRSGAHRHTQRAKTFEYRS